jgi:hypothetical protein
MALHFCRLLPVSGPVDLVRTLENEHRCGWNLHAEGFMARISRRHIPNATVAMSVLNATSENAVVSREERDDQASASTVQDKPSNMSKEDTTPDEAMVGDGDSPSSPAYVTGFKLALVVASIALGCFLMLVDTMVISTVSLPLCAGFWLTI